MSFWDLSDGDTATNTGANFETPGGNFEAMPDGSKVLAMVENAEWKNDNGGNEFLSLQWTVIKPDEVKNRKIFQKLWVTDKDPGAKDEAKAKQKQDRAKRMFSAIDANAGGKLAKINKKPSADEILLALANKPMVIRLGVYSLDDRENPGQKITGNWVQAVAPKSEELYLPNAAPAKARAEPAKAPAYDLDDEIPF